MQRKPLRIQKRNFFRIPKLSDIERSLENVLGKFPECGPRFLLLIHKIYQRILLSSTETLLIGMAICHYKDV